MSESDVSRREFSKLASAAFGGMLIGTSNLKAQDKKKEDENYLLKEPHTCRGLNTCKEVGASKDNACGGMGNCATVKAHECKGMNECKGQGGCGTKPGENACKGKGECAVPLKEKTWKTARKNFEAAMKKAGKKFGDAPPPKKPSAV